MPLERRGSFEFAGQLCTIIGPDIGVGWRAPEFLAVANDFSTIYGLANTHGKVRIIGSLPSLTTSVCDRETRRFNEDASEMGDELVIFMVSRDLPFSQKSWCAAAGIKRVITLSDQKYGEFGEKYGVLIKEPFVFRRAVFVVDRSDQVIYSEYLEKLGSEPNYEAVLTATRSTLQTSRLRRLSSSR
jgi:thiol peroxidase